MLAALDTATPVRKLLRPRAIRAFLFRYQLARLLLYALDIRRDPAGLVTSLASRRLGNSAAAAVQPISAELTDAEKLQRVVDQAW